MSKALKVVGFAAGAIAIVASAGAALGLAPVLGISAETLGTIAAVATLPGDAQSVGIGAIQTSGAGQGAPPGQVRWGGGP